MKVLLLAGGSSSEREVSLSSGKAVFDTLTGLGHTVWAIDPATGASLLSATGEYLTVGEDKGERLPASSATLPLAARLEESDLQDIDVAFIALHGGDGENGAIQNLLDLAGVKYTGSGMAACAVSMDKAVTKRLCRSEGILTPQWELYRFPDRRIQDDLAAQILERFTLPVIVKPNDSGSTVGLSKVERVEDIPRALDTALAESSNVLVEQYIPGRELTVAVLDGRTFPVVEIVPKSGLYDYEAKYSQGKSEYICPAHVPATVAEGVQRAAARLFDITGSAGLARVDFILDDDGRFYCLELNSVPGMTDLSLAPMAAKADGIDFPQLLKLLLESALRRPAK
jgi:D-alanine-D-alanine ligase